MYHYNHKLMENLHSLLKKTRKAVYGEMGTTHGTFPRWVAGEIPCATLVRLCNLYRISLSSFIVLKKDPAVSDRGGDYVYPEEEWRDVAWDHKAIGRMFGPDGMTGITKAEAARRLGLGTYQAFDNWAESPTALRVNELLRVLNEFHLDASLFLKDENHPLPIPDWKTDARHVAEMLDERIKGYAGMQSLLAEKERTINVLRGDKERLQHRVRVLEAAREASPSGRQMPERGYVFHRELWDGLPRMSGMTLTEYCAAIGLPYDSFHKVTNLSIPVLINACNLLRISISHFFLPKGEVPVVHDLGYYSMSGSLFVPIESRMDNIRYLFGRQGVTGYSLEDLDRQGIGFRKYTSLSKDGYMSRVNTLCGICTSFNIPPCIFFRDENRKKAAYSDSLNERLLLNAIGISRENEALKKRVRKLEEKLEQR